MYDTIWLETDEQRSHILPSFLSKYEILKFKIANMHFLQTCREYPPVQGVCVALTIYAVPTSELTASFFPHDVLLAKHIPLAL
jgi:hypothetical protein